MAANQLMAIYPCVRFTNGADDNIVYVQGIDSIRELGYVNDEDAIYLCKTIIRCPGGHLPNPACVAGGATSPMVPYTGITVFQRTNKTTKMQLASSTGMVQPRASHFVTFGMYVACHIHTILHKGRAEQVHKCVRILDWSISKNLSKQLLWDTDWQPAKDPSSMSSTDASLLLMINK